MSQSLSDLIYSKYTHKREDEHSPSNRNVKQDHNDDGRPHRVAASSVIRDTYTYNEFDDFYDQDQLMRGNPTNENKEININKDSNSNQKKYDFQSKSDERQFYESASLSLQNHDGKKGQGSGVKRKNRYADETKEEYEERIRRKSVMRQRRARFRSKRYNFMNEIDYGGSILSTVKLQMDVTGRFDNMKKKKRKIIDTGSDNDSKSEDDDGLKLNRSEDSNKLQNDSDDVSTDENEKNTSHEDNDVKKSQHTHVLGSLLDRIKKEEDIAQLEQKQHFEGSENDIHYRENIDLMNQNPMAFLDHGYIAPLLTDPNLRKYSYRRSLSMPNLGGIRTNEVLYKETRRNSGRFKRAHSMVDSKKSHERQQEEPSVNPVLRNAKNVVASRFLPLNCFNSNIIRLQYPRMLDTYHYLPHPRQDPSSLRVNTTRSNDLGHLVNPFGFYDNVSKSFFPVQFHSTNIQLLAARLVVSCAGKLCDDESSNNNLLRVFDMLHRKNDSSSRISRIIRISRELASNLALWTHLNQRIERLYVAGRLDIHEFNFIRRELLSECSEIVCDPLITTDSVDLRHTAVRRRKMILKLINSCEINSSENFSLGNKSKIDDDIASSSTFSCTFSKNMSDNFQLMTRSERFSQVIHSTKIDLDTIRLTLATLYAELSRCRSSHARKKEEDFFSNRERTVHETILAYLENISNEIWYSGDSAKGSGRIFKSMLNGPLAQVVLMRQSYLANSDSLQLVSEGESSNFRNVAQELYSIGSDLRGDSKLLIFTNIHVTTAISAIATSFPTYAAEIISRHYSNRDNNYQTPIDLMRSSLEMMEQKGDILRIHANTMYQQDHEERVTTNTLITALENAIDIFSNCIEMDSKNLHHMSWIVACRVGCMVLGSNISIGDGPCLARPPAYEEYNGKDSKARHPEYNKQRAQASAAIRELMSWQNVDVINESLYYLTIKTLLEWDEAVYLLSFRPFINPGFISMIRLLHASHMITWSLKDPSVSQLNTLSMLYNEELISRNMFLSYFCELIELDSTNIKFWAFLAIALGPVGSTVSEKRCTRRGCMQCKRLRTGKFNHDSERKHKDHPDYWGRDKVKWWDTTFFVFPPSMIMNITKKHCFEINSEYKQKLSVTDRGTSPLILLEQFNNVDVNLTDVSWMWPIEPSEEDEEDHLLSGIESDSEAEDLPHRENVCNDLPGSRIQNVNDFGLKPVHEDLVKDLGTQYSLIVCKVLVACHMYGVNHEYVKESIMYLWTACFARKTELELNSLSFLARQNLDVVSYLSDLKRLCNHKGQLSSFPFSFTSI